MSTRVRQAFQSAAGAAGGGGLNVEDVFSTYLYTGTGSDQTITNGIDLAGEGGLLWIKNRNNNNSHWLLDSERSNFAARLVTNLTASSYSDSGAYAVPTSTGFTTKGNDANINAGGSGYGYASWTFRKAPKFFDIVTYTGNGPSNTQNISHNLGAAPGMLVVRKTNAIDNWHTWHRGFGDNGYIMLNSTNAKSTYTGLWANTAPTSTHFTISDDCNTNNATYIAYLFAHNDGDGEFGPDGDADIIKCGGYTGNGGVQDIDLGFEAQWVLVKNITSNNSNAARWGIYDVIRGMAPSDTYGAVELNPNRDTVERTGWSSIVPQANGFTLLHGVTMNNQSSNNYIYMAIRRGTKVPESGTEVFETKTYSGTGAAQVLTTSLNAPDMAITQNRSNAGALNPGAYDRLRGDEYLQTSNTSAAISSSSYGISVLSDKQNTVDAGNFASTSGQTYVGQIFKRAPGFFDVVAYTGNGATARAIPHNLGVAPEMMIHKRRNATNDWYVPDFINSKLLILNANASAFNTSILANYYGSGNGSSGGAGSLVTPNASTFTVTPNQNVNKSGDTYIAYLFATLAGVSKVGSYTGNGSNQTINCGFSSGARFILIKRTDSTGDWYVWDTERGIVAGNDPHLSLNTTVAEVTSDDSIDPANSGFIVNQVSATNINVSSATYTFYAIA